MTPATGAPAGGGLATVGHLLTAAHIGPAAAVTTITALLAVASSLDPLTAVTVTAAVLTGQLTIGWGNDLRDAHRDREVGRTDKPLATGELSAGLVTGCLAASAMLCLVLSSAVGWRSALVNIVLGAGSGHAYNLRLKATPFSWLPYALAFGTLPAVVTLAGDDPALPPWWMAAAAAALGVGAHFLNTLPDLAADAATGVRGLPHRMGPGPSRVTATALLVLASLAAVLGPDQQPPWAWAGLAVVLVLAVAALRGQGRRPFQAALLIALVDVALLVAAR